MSGKLKHNKNRKPELFKKETTSCSLIPCCFGAFFGFLIFIGMQILRFRIFQCFGYSHFPGHAFHEKRVLKQIRFVTLINSQERIALTVLLINRLSTVDEMVVNRGFCFSIGFKCELDCPCFQRKVQDIFFRLSGVHKGQMSQWRTGQSTSIHTWYVLDM